MLYQNGEISIAAAKENGVIDMKRKIIIILCCMPLLLIIALKIYLSTPVTVLKIKSEDGKYTVSVIESGKVAYSMAPVKYHEYTLIVKKRWFIFSFEVDREEFAFSFDGAGIYEGAIKIEWHEEYAIVIVDSPDMEPETLVVSLD